MALTPVEDYYNVRSRPGLSAEAATALLLATGDAELPDAVPSQARMKKLNEEVEADAAHLSALECHYKACAYDAQANLTRAAEEAGAQ